MRFESKIITLKDGRSCRFRAPGTADAAEMMRFLKTCAGETDFILRYPEECVETAEQEAAYLDGRNKSETGLMIVAEVDGEIAGNCQIEFNNRIKTRHRATVAIGLLMKFWNLGIGTAMFREMIHIAEARGVTQLELDFIEGNDRAQALYEKMGFRIVGELPDAIRLKDGTLLKEYKMAKKL